MSARRQSDVTPSLKDFAALAKRHSLVPVTRTVAADLDTPVSAFLRVAATEPEAFLLESVEGGEHVGRYTFIGIHPYKRMVARDGKVTVQQGRSRKTITADIFAELKSALDGETPARLPGLPPFTAGAVGFFAYDVVRRIENLPETAADELHVPDAYLMFFDEVLAFDHVKKAIHIIITVGTRIPPAIKMGAPRLASETWARGYKDAIKRLDRLERKLSAAIPKMPSQKVTGPLVLKPRTKPAQFLRAVEKTKEYIAAGDVFQCVLSQRFDCKPGVDAFEIYRSLRIVNPSPYMYFLRFALEPSSDAQRETVKNLSSRPERIAVERSAGRTTAGLHRSSSTASLLSSRSVAKGSASSTTSARPCHIVGSSPELLVRVAKTGNDSRVEYRPIAGTRARGADEAADRALEEDLRADAKEVAEHIMLVDLGRNDVGRVSEFGSVAVKDLMFVERYSHVMHLVSRIEGKLKKDLAPIDAFRACFPAGTLSGAPKIRAMEIIEELEPARRGVYGGSIFYADFSGNLDSCIAIRTLFMDGENGYIQAGAGIVADSIPQKEFEECGNKAKAVVRAIERARGA